MIKQGWGKSSFVEGKSERGIEILDGESNSFGFFHGNGGRFHVSHLFVFRLDSFR